MNKDIQQLIKLMNDDSTDLHTILSGYSVKKLEQIAVLLEWSWQREHTTEYKLLELVLNHRKWKLDAKFVHTPTAIEKRRQFDAQLMNCQTQLCKEAEQEILRLKQKSESNNTLLDKYDYNVECKITPYIFAKDVKQEILFDAYDGIDELLSCMQPEYMLHFEGACMPSKDELDSLCISHWGMGFFGGHSFFSRSDILRINYLCGEIKTIQEHWIEFANSQ